MSRPVTNTARRLPALRSPRDAVFLSRSVLGGAPEPSAYTGDLADPKTFLVNDGLLRLYSFWIVFAKRRALGVASPHVRVSEARRGPEKFQFLVQRRASLGGRAERGSEAVLGGRAGGAGRLHLLCGSHDEALPLPPRRLLGTLLTKTLGPIVGRSRCEGVRNTYQPLPGGTRGARAGHCLPSRVLPPEAPHAALTCTFPRDPLRSEIQCQNQCLPAASVASLAVPWGLLGSSVCSQGRRAAVCCRHVETGSLCFSGSQRPRRCRGRPRGLRALLQPCSVCTGECPAVSGAQGVGRGLPPTQRPTGPAGPRPASLWAPLPSAVPALGPFTGQPMAAAGECS